MVQNLLQLKYKKHTFVIQIETTLYQTSNLFKMSILIYSLIIKLQRFMKAKIKFTFLVVLFCTVSAFAQKNPKLAVSPPMGWNSWNWYGKPDINETIVRQTIDAMANNEFKEAGYVYVVVDGGWRDTKLGPKGELLANPVKFPHGMKALADYAHSKGLKFGVHTVPGTHDCGGDPVGGYNREEVHVKQFVEWGLDFVKVDLCKMIGDSCATCPKGHTTWDEELIKNSYAKWSKLLNTCGRDIVFSISAYKFRDWNPEYCNMSRNTPDILAKICKGGAKFHTPLIKNKGLLTVMEIAELNNTSASAAGNGYWNDPDMMVTGDQGLSLEEQKSHFALWCVMSSPLFLGSDVINMSKAEKELVFNKEMIAINQDPTEQGKLIKNEDGTQVWMKKLKNGKKAVILLNLDTNGKKEVKIDLAELGIKKKTVARDVVNHKKMGSYTKSISAILDTNQSLFVLLK